MPHHRVSPSHPLAVEANRTWPMRSLSCGSTLRIRPVHERRRIRCCSAQQAVAFETHLRWTELTWGDADPLLHARPGSSITLTTQCSIDRWSSVCRQLRSWDGKVSAAVYIPAPRGTPEAAACEQLMRDRLVALKPTQMHQGIAAPTQASPPHPHPKLHGRARHQPYMQDGQSTDEICCAGLSVSLLYANHHAREGSITLRQYLDAARAQGSAPDGQTAIQTTSSNVLRNSQTDTPASDATPTSHTPGGMLTVPTLQLVYEQLYPINALRNLALEAANTPLAMPIDGDFVPSLGAAAEAETLMAQLSKHAEQPELCMLVLPPFEVRLPEDTAPPLPAPSPLHSVELPPLPRTKHHLVQAWRSGLVGRFHCGKWAPKQDSIDYEHWTQLSNGHEAPEAGGGAASARDGDSAEDAAPCSGWYEVPYHEYWEPIGIAACTALPLYDPRFQGYGLNKVQHAYHMAALGFKFLVMRDHFVVTAPHPRSPAFNAAFGTAADPAHKLRVEALYTDFKARLDQGHSPAI